MTRRSRAHRQPEPHNMPEALPNATGSQPLHNTQPFLNHDTLTQDQQAKHLGVKQETVMNLGHPCPVDDLTQHPLGTKRDDYTADKVGQRMVRESDNDGLMPRSGRAWQDYASKNSYGSRRG